MPAQHLSNKRSRREARRSSALERQAAYDALSLEEKLAKVRPGSREAFRLVGVAVDSWDAEHKGVPGVDPGVN